MVGAFSQSTQRQYNFIDTLSKTVGTHQLKFGLDYRRMKPTQVGTDQMNVIASDWATILAGNASMIINDTSDTITAHMDNWSLFAQDTWRANPKLTLTYGLRWDINTSPASDTSGKPLYNIGGVFDSNPVEFDKKTLWNPQLNAFAPRFGIAYQLTPKTVVRSGFGLFYDLGYGNFTSAVMGGGRPYTREGFWFGVPLDFNYVDSSGVNPYKPMPFTLDVVNNGAGVTSVVDPHLRLPFTSEWNVAVERELGANQSVTATYVGANGYRLTRADAVSPVARPDLYIYATRNGGNSNYNALQLQYLRRMSHGLQALVSYSYSHANDQNSSDANGTIAQFLSDVKLPPTTPADFDVRYSFSAALSYETPKTQWGGAVGKAVLNDWALDGIYRLQGAPPIDVTYSVSDPNTGVSWTVRPDLTGQPIWIPDSTQPAGKRINPAAFVLPPNAVSNDALRNGVRSPYRINQADLALRRRFNLTEKVKLDLRAEYFNLFNHPMFTNPYSWIASCYGTTPADCTADGGAYMNDYFGVVFSNAGLTGNGTLNNGNGGQASQYAIGGNRSAQFTLKLTF
jgi:hypothetical protein